MKKKIFSAMILVLVFAGSAFAAPCLGKPAGNAMGYGIPMRQGYMMRDNMTPETRARMEEMHRLRVELREEIQKTVPDKARARDLNNRILNIRQELENQRFNDICANPRLLDGRGKGKNIPAEQRAKMEEVRKLREEIRTELRKDTPDKAKAQAMHTQEQKLTREIETARFEEILKNPAKFAARGQKREISAADKTRINELKKLQEQIRVEFSRDVPDKAKIRKLNKQAQVIKNKLNDSRLEEMLKNPGKFKNSPNFSMGQNAGYCPGFNQDQQ
ncbi:MAG: hypothetical protein LLF78_02365 [Synergistaceae bacterium]|nr:hypothetical protein [Synergistaceae bacterium]